MDDMITDGDVEGDIDEVAEADGFSGGNVTGAEEVDDMIIDGDVEGNNIAIK